MRLAKIDTRDFAKETLTLKTKNVQQLKNFGTRNCGINWIKTQTEMLKLAVSN